MEELWWLLIQIRRPCPLTASLQVYRLMIHYRIAGKVAQSVMCLAVDTSLTADPGGRKIDPGPVPYFGGD